MVVLHGVILTLDICETKIAILKVVMLTGSQVRDTSIGEVEVEGGSPLRPEVHLLNADKALRLHKRPVFVVDMEGGFSDRCQRELSVC